MGCEYYDIWIIFDIGYIIDVCFYVMFMKSGQLKI